MDLLSGHPQHAGPAEEALRLWLSALMVRPGPPTTQPHQIPIELPHP